MKSPKILIVFIAVLSVLMFLSFSIADSAEEYEFLIAQGIQNLNDGKYEEALELLSRALEMAPDNEEAKYYYAVALSRTGKTEDAEARLQKMLQDGESPTDVYFELGRISYVNDDCGKADGYLSKFIASSDDESLKSYAKSLIDDCYAGEKASAGDKPYTVNLTTGVQYDDNVVLEPTNPVLPADRDDDWRGVFLLNAGARLFQNDYVTFRGDYSLYQSLHFDLTNFDVNYQKISPSATIHFSNVVVPKIGYNFEYIFFSKDLYGAIHTFFTEIKIRQSKSYSLDAIWEHRYNRYFDTELFSTNVIRSGRKTTLGLRQNFSWNNLRGNIHYFYDDKRARANYWEFLGHNIGVELNYQIIKPLMIKAKADYTRRDHDGTFPGATEDRVDKMQKYGLRLTYAINDRMAISLTENYTLNDSNMAAYDYDRNILGLLFTWGLI